MSTQVVITLILPDKVKADDVSSIMSNALKEWCQHWRPQKKNKIAKLIAQMLESGSAIQTTPCQNDEETE